jgi:putative ABC transport system permease protein
MRIDRESVMALRKDLIYAVRTLLKSPVFTMTSIVTLALGIGATTAIFSVVRGVLLEPLPYPHANRLVHVCHDLQARNVRDFPFAPGDYHDLREQITLFEETLGIQTFRPTLPGASGEQPEQIGVASVTPNTLRMLGGRVTIGRDFVEADGTPLPPPPPPAPGAPPGAPAPPPPPQPPQAAILSHDFWQRRFGGDAAVINTVYQPFENPNARWLIVGVAAPMELLFPPDQNVEREPDVWLAMRQNFATGSRVNVNMRVLARLKPNVRLAEAQGQVDNLTRDLRKRFPIKETAGFHLRLEPVARDLVADVRPTILALMGAVLFVLLIACANVANLLLVRGVARERELAVRAALGGTRGRLIRQMLTESFVLSVAGAGVGILLAMASVRLLKANGPENVPRLQDVAIDPIVLAFTAVCAVGAAFLFGLVPALRASRPDVHEVLKRGGRSAAVQSSHWLQRGVVVAEVALSFVLLIATGLMIRSFVALQRADPGYNPNGLLTFQIQNLGPSAGMRQGLMRDLHARFSALPGVGDVTSAGPFPLDRESSLARYGTEAALTDPSKFQQAFFHLVQPGYFAAMGTPLVEGRVFTPEDNHPAARVVVIDHLLAKKTWPGESPIGRRLLARVITPEPEAFEVIGVVKHQRHTSLAADGREAVFLPDAYFQFGAADRWALRTTAADPMSLAPQVRQIVTELSPRAYVMEMLPMSFYVDRAQAPTRFVLALISAFGVVAIVLAVVGLYGVLASHVRQRTGEIGVRLAFGAGQSSVFRMLVGSGVTLGAIGIAVGLAMAFFLTGLMREVLVDVRPTDPITFASMALLFLAVTVVASGIPAYRASRLEPTRALRDE